VRARGARDPGATGAVTLALWERRSRGTAAAAEAKKRRQRNAQRDEWGSGAIVASEPAAPRGAQSFRPGRAFVPSLRRRRAHPDPGRAHGESSARPASSSRASRSSGGAVPGSTRGARRSVVERAAAMLRDLLAATRVDDAGPSSREMSRYRELVMPERRRVRGGLPRVHGPLAVPSLTRARGTAVRHGARRGTRYVSAVCSLRGSLRPPPCSIFHPRERSVSCEGQGSGSVCLWE